MIVGPPMYKQSAEIWDWSVDFKSQLGTGQHLVGVLFRAVRESDALEQNLEFTPPAIVGTNAVQLVQGGADGESYIMEFKVTDNTGRKFEAERRLVIRNVP